MKVFANHISDKGFITRIYKELLQCTTTEKEITRFKKWTKNWNRQFSREDIQMANKPMKRCPTLLIVREMQFKNHNEISPYTY